MPTTSWPAASARAAATALSTPPPRAGARPRPLAEARGGGRVRGERGARPRRRHAEADDRRDVLRPGAAAALLRPAGRLRGERDAAAHPERADPRRPAQLVRR